MTEFQTIFLNVLGIYAVTIVLSTALACFSWLFWLVFRGARGKDYYSGRLTSK